MKKDVSLFLIGSAGLAHLDTGKSSGGMVYLRDAMAANGF